MILTLRGKKKQIKFNLKSLINAGIEVRAKVLITRQLYKWDFKTETNGHTCPFQSDMT